MDFDYYTKDIENQTLHPFVRAMTSKGHAQVHVQQNTQNSLVNMNSLSSQDIQVALNNFNESNVVGQEPRTNRVRAGSDNKMGRVDSGQYNHLRASQSLYNQRT